MSKTVRDLRHYGYFRRIQTQQTRKLEQFAFAVLKEDGFYPTNRLASRQGRGIPNSYDDIHIAATWEMDYKDGPLKTYWREWVFGWPDPVHYLSVSRRLRSFRETIRRAS